jgi:hypothetical protein
MSWPVKAILIFLALLAGFFDELMAGWGRPVAVAAVAVLVPVFLRQSRAFWNQARFWIAVATLATAQIPLVIAVRPRIAQGGIAFMLAIGIVDCMFVCIVISLVCSRSDPD